MTAHTTPPDPAEPTVAAEHDTDQGPAPRERAVTADEARAWAQPALDRLNADALAADPAPVSIRDLAGIYAPGGYVQEPTPLTGMFGDDDPDTGPVILTRTRRVLDLITWPDARPAYVALDPDTGAATTRLTVTPGTAADLGHPAQVTVTIEPGDRLTEPVAADLAAATPRPRADADDPAAAQFALLADLRTLADDLADFLAVGPASTLLPAALARTLRDLADQADPQPVPQAHAQADDLDVTAVLLADDTVARVAFAYAARDDEVLTLIDRTRAALTEAAAAVTDAQERRR